MLKGFIGLMAGDPSIYCMQEDSVESHVQRHSRGVEVSKLHSMEKNNN